MSNQQHQPAQKRALIFGISDYANLDDSQQLDFCKNDGAGFYKVLQSPECNFSENNMFVGKVNGTDLTDTINRFFSNTTADGNRTISSDDTLVFYYSGHGVLDPGGDLYLASSDIDPDEPYLRGFPLKGLITRILYCKSTKVVAFLDCYYSGSINFSKGNEEASAKLGTKAIDENSRSLPPEQGKYILSASQAAQEALYRKNDEHSIFTSFLLEGLKGSAVDDKGNVTPRSLAKFVFKKMSEPDYERLKQRPVMRTEDSGEVILASYPNPKPKEKDAISMIISEKQEQRDTSSIAPVQIKQESKVETNLMGSPITHPNEELRSNRAPITNPNEPRIKEIVPEISRVESNKSKLLISIFISVAIGIFIIIFISNFWPHPTSTHFPNTNQQPIKLLGYGNSAYGVKMEYPSGWTIGFNGTGNDGDIATFISPNGTSIYPDANISINTQGLSNFTTNLNNYANYILYNYENSTSFPFFKLLSLSINTTLARNSAYTLIGTYYNYNRPQKVMDIGTIIGDRAYHVQYLVEAPRYSDYLSIMQRMLHSLRIIKPTSSNPVERNNTSGNGNSNSSVTNLLTSSSANITKPATSPSNNGQPQAFDQNLTTRENSPINFTLKGNDTVQIPIRFSVKDSPQDGNLTSFNSKTGEVTYTPNAGFIGNDSFGFLVADNNNKMSNIGSVYITVTAASHAVPLSTYENGTYGVHIQYPSNWSVQGSNDTGDQINVVTFFSPTSGSVTIFTQKFQNSTIDSNNYADSALESYDNSTNFPGFNLIQLKKDSTVFGNPGYTLIGTYNDPSYGLQKVMEVGTVIGNRAYYMQFIANGSMYSEYLPSVQKMMNSLQINATQADDTYFMDGKRYVATYQQGYSDGSASAKESYQTRKEGDPNAGCNMGLSQNYCNGYYAGYNDQWNKLNHKHRSG